MFKILDEQPTSIASTDHPTFSTSSDGIQYQPSSERLQKIQQLQHNIEEAFNTSSDVKSSAPTINESIDTINHTVQFSGYSKIQPHTNHRQVRPLQVSVDVSDNGSDSVSISRPPADTTMTCILYPDTNVKRSNKAAEMYQHLKNVGLFQWRWSLKI